MPLKKKTELAEGAAAQDWAGSVILGR